MAISVNNLDHYLKDRYQMAGEPQAAKPKIAMLGLGAMGSALANSIINGGNDLIVWNRGVDRRESFRGKCAVAETAVAACEAAELVLCCFPSYDGALTVFDNNDIKSALKGKTLIMMGTAVPEEAVKFGAWASENGINYLDAKIATTPVEIGAETTVIFYAGRREQFDRYEGPLKSMAGRTTYVGEKIDNACLGDFAFLSVYWAGVVGSLYGAAFCSATGLDLDQYFDLTQSFMHQVESQNRSYRTMILNRDYTSTVNVALNTDLGAAKLMVNATKAAGLQSLFPDTLVSIFQDAVDRGYGLKDDASLFEVFQAK
ncbi:NAD(P)-dependent oxidoreductase [Acidisoma cellulosilytica]|uniref:NAD(P)-dependent oxidoreductase n=1 Tax=Acidisoma cellulosilyticum TaxID=2802395 RepID=A0A963Z6F0_9PROT|nr:NAD(P)-binding domain-containing protein [Acidisoma cellulosilyticum]MCB8883729.1 NAD(P)-dependent oxidoreductase [Acidisoma cellulosilyticum]